MALKRLDIHFLFALLMTVFVLSSCSNYRKISINDYSIESLSPRGFRAVDAVIGVEVDNPAGAVTISEITGVVKHNGESLASFTSDDLHLDKKTVQKYSLSCSGVLDQSITFMELLKIPSWNADDVTIDIEAKIRIGKGMAKRFKLHDVPLSEIMGYVNGAYKTDRNEI